MHLSVCCIAGCCLRKVSISLKVKHIRRYMGRNKNTGEEEKEVRGRSGDSATKGADHVGVTAVGGAAVTVGRGL